MPGVFLPTAGLDVLALALVGSAMALIGGMIFLFVRSWSDWLARYSIPFASGVLITVALIGLLPEAVHSIGEQAYYVVLIAFLGSFFVEQLLFRLHHYHPHSHHDGHHHPGEVTVGATWLVIIGDTIHNFIDGVAIAAAYLVSPGLGVITAISTFLHEVPHEIGDFGVLLSAGWKRKNILIVNIVSALTTVLGAGMVLYVIADVSVIGVLLAVAAGMFLYLGASDFLPAVVEDSRQKFNLVMILLAGVAVMVAIFQLVPHQHPEVEGDHDHAIESHHHQEVDDHHDDHPHE